MSQVGTKWQKVEKRGQNRIWKQKLNLETIKIFNEKFCGPKIAYKNISDSCGEIINYHKLIEV